MVGIMRSPQVHDPMRGFRWVDRKAVTLPPKDELPVIILRDKWWITNSLDQLLFYHWSPQCNSDKAITRAVGAEWLKRGEIRMELIPVAYVEHVCDD